jgi:hypothetical protein
MKYGKEARRHGKGRVGRGRGLHQPSTEKPSYSCFYCIWVTAKILLLINDSLDSRY